MDWVMLLVGMSFAVNLSIILPAGWLTGKLRGGGRGPLITCNKLGLIGTVVVSAVVPTV